MVPENPLGQGQGLYLLLLAIMVIGNFERALVGFKDQRVVTEGVIHLSALICHRDAPDCGSPVSRPVTTRQGEGVVAARWGRLVALGVGADPIAVLADWAMVRGIYGDHFAGHAGLHIRFGPNATTSGPRR